ncbi:MULTISPECIES: nitroreductase family protein [unclassified Nocardioides]|uniref:nitroreductase family protein n=1 Tax=unclassified Nocardioides TaxID=2615069 RepID=UPI0024073BA0|nr:MULTISPECIES: nitroreductase family protein [unclassified Nocardioides]
MTDAASSLSVTSPSADLVAEPMRSRWSPAVFATDRAVDDATIGGLLAAAAWAPSTGNTQPWAYVVTRLGTAAYDVVVDALSSGNRGWVPTAPVVIVGAVLVGEHEGRSSKGDYSYYDLGQSVAHLTLQAQAVGLHTHQFAGVDGAAVAEGLGVPDAFRVLVGIAVGYVGTDEHVAAAGEADVARHRKERVRRALAESAYDGTWGVPFGG